MVTNHQAAQAPMVTETHNKTGVTRYSTTQRNEAYDQCTFSHVTIRQLLRTSNYLIRLYRVQKYFKNSIFIVYFHFVYNELRAGYMDFNLICDKWAVTS